MEKKNNSVKCSDELANQKVTNYINKECPRDKKNVAVLRILFLHKTRTFKSLSTTLLMDIVINLKKKNTIYISLFLLKIL